MRKNIAMNQKIKTIIVKNKIIKWVYVIMYKLFEWEKYF